MKRGLSVFCIFIMVLFFGLTLIACGSQLKGESGQGSEREEQEQMKAQEEISEVQFLVELRDYLSMQGYTREQFLGIIEEYFDWMYDCEDIKIVRGSPDWEDTSITAKFRIVRGSPDWEDTSITAKFRGRDFSFTIREWLQERQKNTCIADARTLTTQIYMFELDGNDYATLKEYIAAKLPNVIVIWSGDAQNATTSTINDKSGTATVKNGAYSCVVTIVNGVATAASSVSE